jgi:hypothetical protein
LILLLSVINATCSLFPTPADLLISTTFWECTPPTTLSIRYALQIQVSLIMSTQAIYRYTSILIFCSAFIFGSTMKVFAQADTTTVDSTNDEPAKKRIQPTTHQLCLGLDILKPLLNTYTSSKSTYEFQATYYLKNEFYAVGEGGWGGSKVDYPDLKYTSTNSFIRLGFDKSMLVRNAPNDWDLMLMGMRLAYSNINRSTANYSVIDSVWGNTSGTSAAKIFPALWVELTLGMRVELLKGLMAGWNIRGKFMLNGRTFKDLAPLNIAGYGKGDKNSSFDFDVYISYAIRWQKKTSSIKPMLSSDKKSSDK